MSATNGVTTDTKQEQPQQPQSGAQALAQRSPTPLAPTTLGEAWEVARWLAKSTIVPESYRGVPENVLAAIYMGNDLGISPMQAMREIYVVHGRPASSALLKVALVRQSPLCRFWRLVESNDRQATFETQRVGDPEPTRHTYTLEDAKTAGLYPGKGDSNWGKRPKLMLRRRCESELADEVYPDVVKGLRTEDEVAEIGEREVHGGRVVSATVAPTIPASPPAAKQPEPVAPEAKPEPKRSIIKDESTADNYGLRVDAWLSELKQVDAKGIDDMFTAIPPGPRADECKRAWTARRSALTAGGGR